jgi:prepilin-type N-terminal cleavage/methylation domain-containing protein
MDKFKLNKSSRGFTLMELLIVIAIIGILAATLLVALNPAQRIASGRNSRVRADLAALGTEANVYSTDSGLSATCAAPGYPIAFGATCGNATFRALAPNDPSGNPYVIGGVVTAIGIRGAAYFDNTTGGTAAAPGYWCWRSATGQVIWQAAAACP